MHWRSIGIAAADFQIGDGIGCRRQIGYPSAELGQIDGVVGLDKQVGEIDVAVLQRDLGNLDRHRRFGRGIALRRRRLGRGSGLCFRLANDILHIESALRAQDQTGEEVGEGNLTDIDRHRIKTKIDVDEIEGFPLQEIRTVLLVHRQQIAHRQGTLVGRLEYAIFHSRAGLALVRHLTAVEGDIHVVAEVRLQRQDRNGLCFNLECDIERHGLHRAGDTQATSGVDLALQAEIALLARHIAHVLGMQVQSVDLLNRCRPRRLILEAEAEILDRQLGHLTDPGSLILGLGVSRTNGLEHGRR